MIYCLRQNAIHPAAEAAMREVRLSFVISLDVFIIELMGFIKTSNKTSQKRVQLKLLDS
jgi:hypothetical protein